MTTDQVLESYAASSSGKYSSDYVLENPTMYAFMKLCSANPESAVELYQRLIKLRLDRKTTIQQRDLLENINANLAESGVTFNGSIPVNIKTK